MSVRDQGLLDTASRGVFAGYARQRHWTFAPDLERAVSCVALLGTMIFSGIILGASAPAPSRRS